MLQCCICFVLMIKIGVSVYISESISVANIQNRAITRCPSGKWRRFNERNDQYRNQTENIYGGKSLFISNYLFLYLKSKAKERRKFLDVSQALKWLIPALSLFELRSKFVTNLACLAHVSPNLLTCLPN